MRQTMDRACSPMMPPMLFTTEHTEEDTPMTTAKRASALLRILFLFFVALQGCPEKRENGWEKFAHLKSHIRS